jgi:hypothetical protein
MPGPSWNASVMFSHWGASTVTNKPDHVGNNNCVVYKEPLPTLFYKSLRQSVIHASIYSESTMFLTERVSYSRWCGLRSLHSRVAVLLRQNGSSHGESYCPSSTPPPPSASSNLEPWHHRKGPESGVYFRVHTCNVIANNTENATWALWTSVCHIGLMVLVLTLLRSASRKMDQTIHSALPALRDFESPSLEAWITFKELQIKTCRAASPGVHLYGIWSFTIPRECSQPYRHYAVWPAACHFTVDMSQPTRKNWGCWTHFNLPTRLWETGSYHCM